MKNKKSKYKGVTARTDRNLKVWYEARKQNNGEVKTKTFSDEIKAAKAYDMFCISFGLEPVNILKRKN